MGQVLCAQRRNTRFGAFYFGGFGVVFVLGFFFFFVAVLGVFFLGGRDFCLGFFFCLVWFGFLVCLVWVGFFVVFGLVWFGSALVLIWFWFWFSFFGVFLCGFPHNSPMNIYIVL